MYSSQNSSLHVSNRAILSSPLTIYELYEVPYTYIY